MGHRHASTSHFSDVVGGPGKIIGIFFASGREAAAVDEGEQSALRMEVGEERDGGLGRAQGRKILQETGRVVEK